MTVPVPQAAAPPQPPLQDGTETPPVVDGIDATPSQSTDLPLTVTPTPDEDHDKSEPVRRGDLAAFAELFARFQSRIERAVTGRKYRPLKEAWEAASDEILRHKDRIDLYTSSEKVIDALRLGIESGKVIVVDACLDCIHRLFEYGHIGSPGDSTDITLDARDGTLDDLVSMVCSCLEVIDDDVYMRMVQTLLTASTRTRSGLHQGTLLAAVRSIYNIFLNAVTPGTRTTARVSLTQILNLVFARMEAETAENAAAMQSSLGSDIQTTDDQPLASSVDVPEPARPAEEGGDASSEFATVLQKDAYLLFRALCKLSAKDVPEDATSESIGIRSKLLSLELLRNVIHNSGPAFRSGDRFIYALRQYLSPSLLTNCMSNSPDVMDVSFDIFEMLLRKDTLRPLLKTEIGALFGTVIFRFLESPTAGAMRKRRAVTMLNRLSVDRQTMADLFVNYDCDLDSPKIFERIVNVLSNAAEDRKFAASEENVAASTPGSGQVDARVMALTAVVQIVRSLREWSKPLEESKESSKASSVTSQSDGPGGSPDSKKGGSKEVNDVASPISAAEEKAKSTDSVIRTAVKSPSRIRSSSFSGLVLGTISEGSDRDTRKFEQALKARRDMAEGVEAFNAKPKRGIEYLVNSGRLERSAESIADFLHKQENLDASMVGEYLGEGGSFNISVMHAYTDMNDFTDLTFDGALRKHLSGFRLPGEAQKIDRIMEKFASRYCECNPDVFANADAAYILAYSTIMLHTDAHNDTIKHKMSKEDFIKNNRGINDGGDLDPAFLGALYERITKTEIRLVGSKKDSKPGADVKALDSAAAASAMDSAQRARQFKEESERLMAQTKILFANRRRKAQDYTYYPATNVYHARLMFDIAWCPVLAAISLNLEEALPSQTNIVSLCLDGFRHGIAIASTFGMSTTKDALVSSLAKFTHLNSISEMRPKNVECVRMILAIAALEGDNLGEQWVVIVRAVSQLEQVRAVASGNPEKYALQKAPLAGIGSVVGSSGNSAELRGLLTSSSLSSTQSVSVNEEKVVPNSGSGLQYRRSSSGKSTDSGSRVHGGSMQKIDPKAASMATTIAESEIERIFTGSSQLTASGVADLCGALCTVALEELSEPTPRLFCLQKIIEMAYYNMESRTRIQWGKIWLKMGPFFAAAMCHPNRDVAMYSIDALRQLASKFLDKDELSNFSFQRAFLKPFEMCFSRSKSVQIRELVLTCVSQIVLARAANIKSGWKSVFAVLALAADDKIEAIMNFGWQIVDSIVRKYVGVLDDVFVDAVTGIAAYARMSTSTPVSVAAIELLCGRCASCLAEGRALSVLREQMESDTDKTDAGSEILFSDIDAHIGAWFPVLTGLASAIQDNRQDVRVAANSGLYRVLSDHGGKFSSSLWALVFRGVLAPIFDDVRHLSTSSDRGEAAAIGEWATTTGSTSLKSLVDVFVKHISVTRVLFGDILDLVRSWVLQETEVVAREGMSILVRLIMTAGEVLDPNDWEVVVGGINGLFIDTMPHEILGPDKLTSGKDSLTNGVNGSHSSGGDHSVTNGNHVESVLEEDEEETANGNAESPANGEGVEMVGEEVQEVNEEATRRKIDFRVVRAKCVVQLLLIQLVQEIVVSFYRVLSTRDILGMSRSLSASYTFAHDFNADIDLRYSLWRAGFMNQVPNLLKQETNGLMAYLRIVFWLYLDPNRDQEGGSTEEKVIDLCQTVLRGYIKSCQEAQSKSEERREVVALSPVVCFIVNGMMQMSVGQFQKHLPKLHWMLLDLLEDAQEKEVRQAVTRLIKARIQGVVVNEEQSKAFLKLLQSREGIEVGKAQLPGAMRERMIKTELTESGGHTMTEICAALNKVGGVRSVVGSNDESNSFCVISSAPDEMLIAGAESLAYVKYAVAVAAPSAQLD